MKTNYDYLKIMFKANLKLLEYAKESDGDTKEIVVQSIIIGLINYTKELEKKIIMGKS
jgi:hypothetical protein|tara:strand:+ start:525 stop:698 length:174 start_codon:yes stop_codon:yes gene_type:complete